MTARPGLYLLLGLAAALPAAFVAMPAALEGYAALREIRELGAAEHIGPEAFAALIQLRDTTWPEVRACSEALRACIPRVEARADRLVLVEQLARASGVRVSASHEEAQEAGDGSCAAFSYHALAVEFEGTSATAIAFLAAVEMAPRLVLVSGLNFRRRDESPLLVRGRIEMRFPCRLDDAVPARIGAFPGETNQ